MVATEGQRSRRAPRYEGEDTTVTTQRELWGWYAYMIAAEVFAVCGVGSFLPVTLEQLARERGVFFSDKTTPCTASAPPVSSSPSRSLGRLLAREAERPADQCVVRIFGSDVTTSSFAMYTFSLGVLIQAFALISFSSLADYGNYRKRLLVGFAFTGSISAMFFIFVVPKIFIVGSFLTIIGVVSMGSSFVLFNSFLPVLVANHPSISTRGNNSKDDPESVPLENLQSDDRDSLSIDLEPEDYVNIPSKKSDSSPDSVELQLSTKFSSRATGIGYAAAVSVQLICVVMLFVMSKISFFSSSSTLSLRIVLFFVGLWWLGFTIPTQMWLRDRPGPPLYSVLPDTKSNWRAFWSYFTFAWSSLWKTIKIAVKLRQMAVYLISWFLLSDAISTVNATAILFARTELKLSTVAVALLSITTMASAFSGAMLWPIIARRFSLESRHTLVLCVIVLELIPLYGLMGYLPFIQSWGVGGLQQPWEIFPLAVVFGFVMGGINSFSRSFFGLLIPPGSEAAFYALYAITDKGSSAVGPTIAGMIIDATGKIRPAFGFLAVLIALTAPILWIVNVDKGKEDALRMAGILKKLSGSDENIREGNGGIQEAEGLLANHS
ncbi:autophagy-related protein 22-like protein [Xylogone sp. PMI_703]|nr:autophagy-related protein 22-like protein [Xylogone sp. PMI_703]